MITPREIEWGAGFYEGEGSIVFNGCPRVEIQQTQLWPLEKMQKLFGGKIYQRKKLDAKSRQTTWTWHLPGAHGVGFVLTIYKLLSPRRQMKIREVLALWKTTPTRMYAIAAMERRRNGR